MMDSFEWLEEQGFFATTLDEFDEKQARQAIIKWAKSYFNVFEAIGTPPKVTVLSMKHNHDEWEAELEVSSSADNPYVTFSIDKQYKAHVSIIKY